MKGGLLGRPFRKRPRSPRQWGQTFAFLAIGLPAFIGAMGLATDAGMYYFNQYKLQTAVDAAALAGVHCLPDQTKCTASSTASSYATTNGVGAGEIVGPTVDTGNNTVTVGAQRNVPYYFARLVGVTQGAVNVTATAQIGLAGSVNNPFPIGLQYCNPGGGSPAPCPYDVGDSFAMTGSTTNPIPAPGNWGPILFPNNNAVYCTSGTCTSVQSDTGCARIKAVADLASGMIGKSVTVPLVDWTGVTGTKYMNVYGFAEVTINSVSTGSGCSTAPVINVTITNQVVSGSIYNGGGTPPPNSGTYAEKLIS
jgi:hypothetical protein